MKSLHRQPIELAYNHASVQTDVDHVTVLTSGTKPLTKTFSLLDGRLTGTTPNVGALFAVEQTPVTDLASLSTLLTDLEGQISKMVIRGEPRDGINRASSPRRSNGANATFASMPRRWALLDVDGVTCPPELSDFNAHADEIVGYVRCLLPKEFQDVACHWQFSSSMGVKRGLIKLHLWFWLSRPVSDEEMKAWLAGSAVDQIVYHPVQAHFTAAPIFDPRTLDPVTVRSGLLSGTASTVSVPEKFTPVTVRPSPVRRVVDGRIEPSVIVRNDVGLVIDGRDTLLFHQSLKAVGELTAGDKIPSMEQLTNRTWELFAAEADLSDGKWTKDRAERKAQARLEDLAGGKTFRGKSTSTILYSAPSSFDVQTVDASTGTAQLDQSVNAFFERIEKGPMAKALNVTMGAGKSTATRKRLVKSLRGFPRNVAIYVPTHELALEYLADLNDIPHVETKHIRGYTHGWETGHALCKRWEYVKALENKKLSVRPNVCIRGNDHCEHYATCAYWEQYRAEPQQLGSVRVYPHAQMKFKRHATEPKPDLVIVDENCLAALHEQHQLSLEDVRVGFFEKGESHVGNEVAEAIRVGSPLLATLRSLGIDRQWLETLTFSGTGLAFSPSGVEANFSSQHESGAKRLNAQRALKAVLIEELDTGRDDAVRVRFNPHLNQAVIDCLASFHVPADASLLILDGTLDEAIVRQLFGKGRQIDFERIDIEQKAYVTQVYDRTGSKTQLERSSEDRRKLATFLKMQAVPGERVLCVTYKDVARLLEAENPPDNVVIDHFGNIRGSNQYKDFDTVVIAGRNQPGSPDVEGLARALWWDDPIPLQFDEGAKLGKSPATDLPTQLRGYALADPDQQSGVSVRSFSDDRIEALQRQIREAETVQALARLRMVHSPKVKRVFLLANLPVAIPVDELVTWDELMPDWTEHMIVEKGHVPATPASLMKLRPSATEDSASSALRRSKVRQGLALRYGRYDPRLASVPVSFREIRDGRPFGRKQTHYFAANVDESGLWSSLSLHHAKAVLEDGDPSVPDSGWGEIAIV